MFSVLCYFRNDLLNSLHLRKEELIGCYFSSVSKLTQYFTKLKYFFRISPIPSASLHSCVTGFFFSILFFCWKEVLVLSVILVTCAECRVPETRGTLHQCVVAINICFSQGFVYFILSMCILQCRTQETCFVRLMKVTKILKSILIIKALFIKNKLY